MREKWAEGTVLYTQDGAEYKITTSNEAGGTAIIYYAEKAGSGIRAVLKEFYPEGWERRKGIPVERAYVDSPDEDQGLLSCYKKLAEQAAREMTISQEVARETVHVWPVRRMLDVQSIREPNGTVWQVEGTLPCCILEMDNLNHKDGLWLQDILREAGKAKSEETPLGNLQPNSKPVLAVPPLQVTLMLVWRLLILLAKIHAAGYLHGDINLGNVFLAMDDTGANVLNAMLIDFGSARALVNGETAPLGKEPVMATPGFAAPELAGSGEQRLTPKADVYAVGKLMHCLLDQNILEALRKGWYSDLEEELKAPTLNASGINDPQITPAVRKSLDQILSGAAEIKPEKRSSVQEMMEQVMQLYRKIEPPAWQMSLGLLQLNGDEVLGRDEDIKKIEAKLWAEEKLVLHGFSGIGKTKLVTLLGHKWLKNYPCSQVYYAFYPGSMTGLAVDTLARNMSTVAFTEQKNGKDVPRPVAGIIHDMFQELNAHMHENDLLIIDNVDDDTKKYWNSVVHEETVPGQVDVFTRLCQLNCKVLFVTRLDVSDVTGIVPFEVDRLEPEPLRAILRENSKDANGYSDAQKRSDEELDRLIALVDRHTMTVDMIARTMRESELTVPEIYDELRRDDYDSDAFVEISGQKDTDYSENRIEGHLIRLFRLANFNEREQNMLRYAQLIGENSGMCKTLFLSCCPHETKGENTQNLSALNHLIRLGYVQQKKEEDSEEVILNLHTLVRVVARKRLVISPEQCDDFLRRGQAMIDAGEPDHQIGLIDAYNEAWMIYAHKVPIAYLWASYLMVYLPSWWEREADDTIDYECFTEVLAFSMQEGIENYPWIKNLYFNLFAWFYWQIHMYSEELYRLKESDKFCQLIWGKKDVKEKSLTFSEELMILQKYAEAGQKFLKGFNPETPREQDLVLWVYDTLYDLYKNLANVPDAAVYCAEQVLQITKKRYPGQTGVTLKNLFNGYIDGYIQIVNYYDDLGRREELVRELRKNAEPQKNGFTETENISCVRQNEDVIERVIQHAKTAVMNVDYLMPQDFYLRDNVDIMIHMARRSLKDDEKIIEGLKAAALFWKLEADGSDEERVLKWTATNILMARLYICLNKRELADSVFELAERELWIRIKNNPQIDKTLAACYISICTRRSLLYALQKLYKKAVECIEKAISLAGNIDTYRQLTILLLLEQKSVFYEHCDCEAKATQERHRMIEMFQIDSTLKLEKDRTADKYFMVVEKMLCLLEQEKNYTQELKILKDLICKELELTGGGLIKKAGDREKLEEHYQQAICAAEKIGEVEEARRISREAYKSFSENIPIWPVEFIRISCTRAYFVCEYDSSEAEDILKKAFECLKQIFEKEQFKKFTRNQLEKLFGAKGVQFFKTKLEMLQGRFPEKVAITDWQRKILEEAEILQKGFGQKFLQSNIWDKL